MSIWNKLWKRQLKVQTLSSWGREGRVVAVSQTGGRELGETGRMRRGEKREGCWEEGSKMSSDVSWAREEAANVKVSSTCLRNLRLSRQANPFLFPEQNSHLGRKVFLSCTFSATGDWKDHPPTHCNMPHEAWVREVNEPTFSIIPVGVFMGEKLITCDKYAGAWTSHHFCQAACEQKHFSNPVILAVDSPNHCPVQELESTQLKQRPQTRSQNMTDHKKCKVLELWHWWHAVSRVKTLYTCCHFVFTL